MLEQTDALVARGDGQGFSACRVWLAWTKEELFDECGQPAKTMPRTSGAGTCYYYPTLARGFITGQGAPGVVVCVGKDRLKLRNDGPAVEGEFVDEVVGVEREP